MNDYFTPIILSISFINSIILIYDLVEYNKYKREKEKKDFKRKIEQIKDKERRQLINYISSELHDNISQMLSLAIMNLGVLNFDSKEKSIVNLKSLLDKTLIDIRYLIKTIKLRESLEFDLDYQIEDLINILNQSTPIIFSKEGKVPVLSNERKYLFLRVLQELLNNILKHSKATLVKLIFKNSDFSSEVKIIHNGTEFIPSNKDFQKGYGLTNIYENTKMLNGELFFQFENSNTVLKLPIT